VRQNQKLQPTLYYTSIGLGDQKQLNRIHRTDWDARITKC